MSLHLTLLSPLALGTLASFLTKPKIISNFPSIKVMPGDSKHTSRFSLLRKLISRSLEESWECIWLIIVTLHTHRMLQLKSASSYVHILIDFHLYKEEGNICHEAFYMHPFIGYKRIPPMFKKGEVQYFLARKQDSSDSTHFYQNPGLLLLRFSLVAYTLTMICLAMFVTYSALCSLSFLDL